MLFLLQVIFFIFGIVEIETITKDITISFLDFSFKILICSLVNWFQIGSRTMEIKRVMPLLFSTEDHVLLNLAIIEEFVSVGRFVFYFNFFSIKIFLQFCFFFMTLLMLRLLRLVNILSVIFINLLYLLKFNVIC